MTCSFSNCSAECWATAQLAADWAAACFGHRAPPLAPRAPCSVTASAGYPCDPIHNASTPPALHPTGAGALRCNGVAAAVAACSGWMDYRNAVHLEPLQVHFIQGNVLSCYWHIPVSLAASLPVSQVSPNPCNDSSENSTAVYRAVTYMTS